MSFLDALKTAILVVLIMTLCVFGVFLLMFLGAIMLGKIGIFLGLIIALIAFMAGMIYGLTNN